MRWKLHVLIFTPSPANLRFAFPFPNHQLVLSLLFLLAVEGGEHLGGAAPFPPQSPLPDEQGTYLINPPWGEGFGVGVDLS